MVMAEIASGVVDKIAKHELTRTIVRTTIPYLIRAGIRMTNFEDLDSGISKLPSSLAPNDMLIYVASHKSYADLIPILESVSRTRRAVSGLGNVYLPLSASVEGGQHGPVAEVFYSEGGKLALLDQGIHPLNIVTENDRIKRGLESNDLQQRQELGRIIAEPHSSMFIFPEGTLEGGRYYDDGRVKGIQRVKRRVLSLILLRAQEANRNVILFPLGISGTNRLLSAESDFLTPESLWGLLQQRLGRNQYLAKVRASEPLRLSYRKGFDADEYAMSSIAELLPEEERGCYKEKKDGKQIEAA